MEKNSLVLKSKQRQKKKNKKNKKNGKDELIPIS